MKKSNPPLWPKKLGFQQKNYHVINRIDQLEQLFEVEYPDQYREKLQSHIFKHPLRFTSYLLEQIRRFPVIAAQYIPQIEEIDNRGLKRSMPGIIKTGIAGLERLYADRVILMPSGKCFAYCRFCFRKDYSHDVRDGDFSKPHISLAKAIEYIKNDSNIKEVLITGGDPLLFPEFTIELCKQLRNIAHLTSIRIGSRIFTSDPKKIFAPWLQHISQLNTSSYKTLEGLDWKSKIPCPISISPHINHPDELNRETSQALLYCSQNNIPLYSQTVFLNGINTQAETLALLFRQLRQLGVEPYRIYHADPLQGTEHFRTPLSDFLNAKKWLRANCSGRIIPHFIVDTRIGKVDIGSDSNIIKKEGHTLWIKTPYTKDIYFKYDPQWKIPSDCYESEDGFLVIAYEDKQVSQ